MPYPGETWVHPVVPPGEDELPCSDGEPMETELHRKGMSLLIESLDLAWRDRNDVYVGGNMFVYFSELQVKHNDFRGPDVFVVLDTVRRVRKSWVVWQEERTPDVVIELTSPSTAKVDHEDKMRIYAKVMKVADYFIFDPETLAFEGYTLDPAAHAYRAITAEPSGDRVSRSLGLRLGIRRGVYQGVENDWLRWIDAEGNVLPSGEELARAAEERASTAEERASTAEERAAEMAAKLAVYEERFGKLS